MDGTSVRVSGAEFGHVSVRPIGLERRNPLDQWLYTWHPGPKIARERCADLALPLRCLVTGDGSRGFCPAEDVEGFLVRASVGGLMILSKRRGMKPLVRGHHHALRLLYQQARLSSEYLGRSFHTVASLLVVGNDGAALGGPDVLPARLGLNSRGRGRRWSVGKLMRCGRAAATAAGFAQPDEGQCIAAGLYEAARLDPFPADRHSSSATRALVEMALFDSPRSARPDPDEERAIARILDRLGDHLADDSASFRRWFFDGRDNLIRQVAKQAKGGGPIDRATVRRALSSLVRSAYQSVGTCVSAQMEAFIDSLPQPLDIRELARFSAVYLGRRYLGGMPLLMLHERFPFLRPAVLGVMNEPDDPDRVGALLTMLAYYGEMAPARRGADRSYKQRANRRNRLGRVAMSVPFGEEGDASSPGPDAGDSLRHVAQRLRMIGNISCTCADGGVWEVRLVGDADEDPVEVEVNCSTCGHDERFPARREALAAIGNEMCEADL